MITAKEARQESNKATERKVSRERIQSKKVERKVRKAIRKGMTKCTFLVLNRSTIEWLETLGYTVEEEPYGDMSYCWVVRW